MTTYTDFNDIPLFRYKVIVADIPTEYRTYSDLGKDRSPEKHYDTMPLEDIEDIPVADIAAPDSILFFWTTGCLSATPRAKMLDRIDPRMKWAFDVESVHLSVMNKWGFESRALAFVWIKTNKNFVGDAITDSDWFGGLGHYTSQNVELCYIGVRGRPGEPIQSMQPQVVTAPVREHSRKPDQVMERIARMYSGPRIELFSREEKPGFDAFGDQVGKFEGEMK